TKPDTDVHAVAWPPVYRDGHRTQHRRGLALRIADAAVKGELPIERPAREHVDVPTARRGLANAGIRCDVQANAAAHAGIRLERVLIDAIERGFHCDVVAKPVSAEHERARRRIVDGWRYEPGPYRACRAQGDAGRFRCVIAHRNTAVEAVRGC